MIEKVIKRIMNEYPFAREKTFAKNPLAHYIRHEVPDHFKSQVPNESDLLWVASPGQGQWSDAPWIAAFDPLVTESAQEGYYPVYLSFNQGVTKLRNEFGNRQAEEILINKAGIFRRRLSPEYESRFDRKPINLQSRGPSTNLAFYEYGHSFGCKYNKDEIPTTQELIKDLRFMIELYRLSIARGGSDELDHEIPDDDTTKDFADMTLEEKRRRKYHSTIERNPKLARMAKRIHGYTCQACGFDFEKKYGKLGEKYIEAHHLIPLSKLQGERVKLSPRDDFSVVCSNCHRMIHRKGAPPSFKEFVRIYKE